MAANETTFLEPPATPAPLFAYRALRGFIFGSPNPNESPERFSQITDKENILPPRLGSTTKELLKNSHTPRLSPPKRKRGSDALALPNSPTKGILRTPGALTPRAKALRDVNVKFRSVSPEVRRKDAEHDSAMAAAATARSKDKPTKMNNAKGDNEGDTNTPSKDRLQKPPTTSTTTAHSSFDDYQRRTERQMKILIVERNKWRDMARRSGNENTWLKLQLAQAQRKNERLETKLRVLEPSQPSQQSPLPSDHVDRQGEHSRLAKKPKPKSKTSKYPTTTVAAPSSSHSHLPLRPLSPLTSLSQRLEPDPRPETAPESHTAARTGLAPDRYSAARARLQARQQARKASSSLRMGGADGTGKMRQSMDEAEESHIDWAGLALG
ncbi:hypothetical protein DV736_g1346, partial [Chaetothyriales sp. CBS 134916]